MSQSSSPRGTFVDSRLDNTPSQVRGFTGDFYTPQSAPSQTSTYHTSLRRPVVAREQGGPNPPRISLFAEESPDKESSPLAVSFHYNSSGEDDPFGEEFPVVETKEKDLDNKIKTKTFKEDVGSSSSSSSSSSNSDDENEEKNSTLDKADLTLEAPNPFSAFDGLGRKVSSDSASTSSSESLENKIVKNADEEEVRPACSHSDGEEERVETNVTAAKEQETQFTTVGDIMRLQEDSSASSSVRKETVVSTPTPDELHIFKEDDVSDKENAAAGPQRSSTTHSILVDEKIDSSPSTKTSACEEDSTDVDSMDDEREAAESAEPPAVEEEKVTLASTNGVLKNNDDVQHVMDAEKTSKDEENVPVESSNEESNRLDTQNSNTDASLVNHVGPLSAQEASEQENKNISSSKSPSQEVIRQTSSRRSSFVLECPDTPLHLPEDMSVEELRQTAMQMTRERDEMFELLKTFSEEGSEARTSEEYHDIPKKETTGEVPMSRPRSMYPDTTEESVFADAYNEKSTSPNEKSGPQCSPEKLTDLPQSESKVDPKMEAKKEVVEQDEGQVMDTEEFFDVNREVNSCKSASSIETDRASRTSEEGRGQEESNLAKLLQHPDSSLSFTIQFSEGEERDSIVLQRDQELHFIFKAFKSYIDLFDIVSLESPQNLKTPRGKNDSTEPKNASVFMNSKENPPGRIIYKKDYKEDLNEGKVGKINDQPIEYKGLLNEKKDSDTTSSYRSRWHATDFYSAGASEGRKRYEDAFSSWKDRPFIESTAFTSEGSKLNLKYGKPTDSSHVYSGNWSYTPLFPKKRMDLNSSSLVSPIKKSNYSLSTPILNSTEKLSWHHPKKEAHSRLAGDSETHHSFMANRYTPEKMGERMSRDAPAEVSRRSGFEESGSLPKSNHLSLIYAEDTTRHSRPLHESSRLDSRGDRPLSRPIHWTHESAPQNEGNLVVPLPTKILLKRMHRLLILEDTFRGEIEEECEEERTLLLKKIRKLLEKTESETSRNPKLNPNGSTSAARPKPQTHGTVTVVQRTASKKRNVAPKKNNPPVEDEVAVYNSPILKAYVNARLQLFPHDNCPYAFEKNDQLLSIEGKRITELQDLLQWERYYYSVEEKKNRGLAHRNTTQYLTVLRNNKKVPLRVGEAQGARWVY